MDAPKNGNVRLSVTMCFVVLGISVGCSSCIVIFIGIDFLFTSSDTFAVGCIV